MTRSSHLYIFSSWINHDSAWAMNFLSISPFSSHNASTYNMEVKLALLQFT
uniref:Uncharacterized protein n=1 Tax=Arundo donax TaxID=35708 RepID=A0A0A9HKT4_ARUDO